MAFQDILKGTIAYLADKSKDALKWYKEKILGIGKTSSTTEVDNVMKKVSMPEIGKMYIYTYNPLTREKLPFFDMYPLTIPFDYYNAKNGAGFIGINLHYLPPGARLSLLNNLLQLRNNDKYDSTTKLNISYKLLQAYTSQLNNSSYKQCIKRYLFGHVVSSFHEINANDWEKVILLPLQKWVINPNRARKGSPPY